MEWNVEKTSLLIELYRANPELWDTHSPVFKNKQKKHDAWKRIAEALNLGKDEVEKKMRCLIGQFQREKKKTKSGAGLDEVYESKWFAFKMLTFLTDRNKPRETTEAGIEKTNDKLESQLGRNDVSNANDSEEASNLPTGSSSNTTSQAPTKKRRLNKAVLDKRQEEAYSVLQSLQKNYCKRDEYDVYGELIAKRIRKLPDNIKDHVMHDIDDIIFKASCTFMDPQNCRNLTNQYQPIASFTKTNHFPFSPPNYLNSSQSFYSSPYNGKQNCQQPPPNHQVQVQYSQNSSFSSQCQYTQLTSPNSENYVSDSASPCTENISTSPINSPLNPNSEPPNVYCSNPQDESGTDLLNIQSYIIEFNPSE